MSVKLTRRIASEMMKRGVSSVRIKPSAFEDAQKAITRDDVRGLIKNGSIYAIAEKHNMSLYSKALGKKRSKGRSRGSGRRKGTRRAREGIQYKKKIRAQRRVLASLKSEKRIDNAMYKKLYLLVKGGNFVSKVTLLNRVRSEGIELDDAQFEKLRHM